jgi:predicted small lipoprotein YifL
MTAPIRSRARAFHVETAVAALLGLALLTQCGLKPQPLPPQNVTATEIVAQNAKDAFATFLDAKADHDSMQAYATSIAGAKSRQDLGSAWNQIPGLANKGATFLEDHVFSKAAAEAKWPPNQTPAQLEPSFVAGIQEAVAAFLKQGAP